MTAFDWAGQAFRTIYEDCPANNCQTDGPDRVDAGLHAPGGWSSARLLLEGLHGGKATAAVTWLPNGADQIPTVQVLCDDPVLAAESFLRKDGTIGLRDGEGRWHLAYQEGEPATVDGPLVYAGPASLCAAVIAAGALAGRAARYLLEAGLPPEDLLWSWSSAPVVLPAFDSAACAQYRQEALSKSGVCGLWIRHTRPDLEALAQAHTAFQLRLHCMEDGKTYLGRGRSHS